MSSASRIGCQKGVTMTACPKRTCGASVAAGAISNSGLAGVGVQTFLQDSDMRRGIPLVAILAAACWLTLTASGAAASRFGTPWQARVIVDQTLVHLAPDAGSAVSGPLGRGSIVVVTA